MRFEAVAMLLAAALCLPVAAQEPAPAAEAPPPEAQETPPPAPAPEPAFPDIRQVQIQVWISETGEQGLRDLGANLVYSRVVRGHETSGSVQQITTSVTNLRDPLFSVTLPAPQQQRPFFGAPPPVEALPFPAPMRPDLAGNLGDGLQTQEGVGVTFTIIPSEHGTIDGAFRAVEEKSDIDLISKPELLVINGAPAEIHAGSQVPYQGIRYEKGQPQTNVEWKDVGVKMKLTPTIRSDNMIRLHLEELEVTDIARIDSIRSIDLPVFSTRSQKGEVLVPNGQTLVIGGLSTRVIRKTERRVPIVGLVPVLGIPFRGRRSEATTNHLLVFVSPTVVDLFRLDQTAVDALQFWQRERWRHHEHIDEELRLFKDNM